jgi:hypothetical protein
MHRPHRSYLLLALALLLVAAPRIIYSHGLRLDNDEVWTIWQTFGTPGQIIAWAPYDWPPVYYLAVGLWKEFVGIYPFMVRMLSVLASILGGAFLYCATRKLTAKNETASLFAVVAYGALQYSISISTLVRGYVFLLALAPLALWLTMRYFERPSVWRALPLALCMVIMFYSHLTAILIFALLGLYSLLFHPRQIWRWWLPGLFAIIPALPEIVDKYRITVSRVHITQEIKLPPLFEALRSLFVEFTDTSTVIWLALLIVAVLALLVYWRRAPQKLRLAMLLVVLWVLAPIAVYYLNPVLGFFIARHLAWVIIGLTMGIGWGISRLPRAGKGLALAGLVVATFSPIPMSNRMYSPPFEDNFAWLSKNMRQGDVLLIDPNFDGAAPEEWDYYARVFFPNGLKFVNEPGDYRRIWYVQIDGKQDKATQAALLKDHIAEEFVGPWNFLFRLYEAPPDVTGVLYENGLRFRGAEVISAFPPSLPVFHDGETVRLRLWWSIDRPVTQDYSISTQLLDKNGRLLTQFDGLPQVTDAPRETSRWEPGRYYIEERDLTAPTPFISGGYTVYLVVYQLWDGTRIAAPGQDQNLMLPIQRIYAKSWRLP